MDMHDKVIRAGGRDLRLRIETSAEACDYEKYERLRNEIWGFPEDNLPGSRNLMCENYLHDGGSLFIAVQTLGEEAGGLSDGRRLAAFSYGFVGVKDKEVAFRKCDNLRFYSQYTAVRPEFRGAGLGVAIKEFQREKVRSLFGINTITCTYDPLTGVNARRNVHHFGMEVEDYRVSTYGEYGGFLNRLDVPSDRFFMTWDLSRPAAPGESPWASRRRTFNPATEAGSRWDSSQPWVTSSWHSHSKPRARAAIGAGGRQAVTLSRACSIGSGYSS